jgi:hypothetical protein
MLSKEKLSEMLIVRWDYIPIQSPDTAEKLINMDASIVKAFENWLETGIFPVDPVFSRYNPKIINELWPLKPPAVFLLLDWISKKPNEALEAIFDEFK